MTSRETELIEWSEKYLIGIPEIDFQHKSLIRIINQFTDCNANAEFGELLKEFSDAMFSHNQYEERLLEKHSYPDLDHHKREHAIEYSAFSARIKELINDEKDSQATIISQLKYWLEHHLLIDDMAYRQFLIKKGVL